MNMLNPKNRKKTMKTFRLFSMAALALAMAACSSEDNEILQNTQQPGTMHFTATIAAPSGDATTRTAYTEVGKTINVTWEVDDEIALVHNGVVDVAKVTAVDGSGNATIEATITDSPADNDDVYLAYPADAVFSATPYKTFHFTPHPDIFDKVKNYQDGTLAYIQNNLDLRTGDGKLAVDGDKVTLKESVSVSSLICIWKLTLQDESSNPLSASQLTFKNETYTLAKATSAAKNEYYLCVVPGYIPAPAGTYSFEATVGGDTYTFSKTDLYLNAGKYYQSTVTMAKSTDLSTISSDYEVKNGEVLTGTLGSNVKISIAAGATVTLKDVDINGSGTWKSGEYAGITCAGNATIILEGTNSVKGFDEDYPGIYVPSGNTLIIQGTGSLNVSSNGIGAAGIGGGEDGACGNIVISGGTITATGGEGAAGIGSGQSYDENASCGNITISGGTIKATGGEDAAGIGSGRGYITSGVDRPSTCGAITITSGVTSVKATAGSGANSIGAGYKSTCGTVTIGGTEYWDGSDYKNGGDTYLTTSQLTYPAAP